MSSAADDESNTPSAADAAKINDENAKILRAYHDFVGSHTGNGFPNQFDTSGYDTLLGPFIVQFGTLSNYTKDTVVDGDTKHKGDPIPLIYWLKPDTDASHDNEGAKAADRAEYDDKVITSGAGSIQVPDGAPAMTAEEATKQFNARFRQIARPILQQLNEHKATMRFVIYAGVLGVVLVILLLLYFTYGR